MRERERERERERNRWESYTHAHKSTYVIWNISMHIYFSAFLNCFFVLKNCKNGILMLLWLWLTSLPKFFLTNHPFVFFNFQCIVGTQPQDLILLKTNHIPTWLKQFGTCKFSVNKYEMDTLEMDKYLGLHLSLYRVDTQEFLATPRT